jgi:hypothetical protein
MLTAALNAAAARVERLAERVDLAAAYWLLGRELPRRLVLHLLERLAAQVGAKLEITDLP